MRWKHITLKDYQHINAIDQDQSFDSIDKTMHITCYLFDYTENTLPKLPLKKVQKLILKTTKLFARLFPTKSPKCIGKYLLNYDMDKVLFGQYIELAHFLKGDNIDNAGQILASISRLPFRSNNSNNHKLVSAYYLLKPVTKVVGAMKKISESFTAFNLEYDSLFEFSDYDKGLIKDDEEPLPTPSQEGFNEMYGWIYSATVIAEHRRIPLEEVYKITSREALNDLCYLKSKRNYDNEQLKQLHVS
jgi:hypothetical protein